MQTENPQITLLLRLVTFVEVLVLAAAGFGLFFVYATAAPMWAWDIKPFNAGFMGAIYLASFTTVLLLFIVGRWTPARLALPMLFTFTAIVLIVSLFNLDRFHFDRWVTWVWFALYIIVPIDSLYHLWLYRRLAPAQSAATPPAWRAYLIAQGIVLGGYSLAMLIAPTTFTGFWPWSFDAFHAQVYSAVGFVAVATALTLARRIAPLDFLTLGLLQTILGIFSILDVITKSAPANYPAGTWLWLGAFAIIGISGIAMIVRSRSLKS